MNVRTLALLPALLIATVAASSIDIPNELQQCRRLSDLERRLACFDVLAFRHSPPRFAGRHGATTEAFITTGPQRLRYQSDGAIFVMYLRDAEGGVLQNITLPGGGEDSYRIDKAGTYSLQVNGSETWRIWIDPP
ncbi:hypothetical protein [uncultured Nevskia sp.]|uniref:hypothetical protein n=1 Tax=uncultured Nevskia sp. TaxID=228950 RepID=UPI0025E0F14A|nr:hypothetical protein [uncultured Nevskia sp.]